MENLSVAEVSDLFKNLRLQKKDFDKEDLVKYEARVNTDLDQICFPVRYVCNEIQQMIFISIAKYFTSEMHRSRYTDGRIVCLRKVKLDPGGHLVESNVPEQPRQSILPFPHGLYQPELSSSSMVLVGSILDSLALSKRINLPVVTLPDASTLHPDHLPFLEVFHTVFLWLANDLQGTDNSTLFARKIGEKRCRLVSRQHPDPLRSVRQRLDVREVLSTARSSYHEFLTTFEALRDNVYLEFVQSEEMMGVPWRRFEPLNKILGGFRRGELTVFSGRTGSGKTTFLSEYSLDLCMQGVNTLWCSFEVKNTRLLRMMLKQFSLVNLDERLEEFDTVADHFGRLPLYLTDFHGSQRLEQVQEAMSHAVYVHDITHIIVDNMQFMLGTAQSGADRFQVQDTAIEIFR